MSITCKSLGYIYGQETPFEYVALQDVNLQIEDGSFTAIIGQTGSGKSTLIQHMNALLTPTSGEIIVDDYRITATEKPESLKQLRQKNKLTQSELAEILNLKPTAISNYESKRNEPSFDKLIALARYFDVSCDYLLGVTDDYLPIGGEVLDSEIVRFFHIYQQPHLRNKQVFHNEKHPFFLHHRHKNTRGLHERAQKDHMQFFPNTLPHTKQGHILWLALQYITDFYATQHP